MEIGTGLSHAENDKETMHSPVARELLAFAVWQYPDTLMPEQKERKH